MEQNPNRLLVIAVDTLKAEKKIKWDADIAESTGFSKPVVSNYLKGRVKASKNFLQKFSEIYNVDFKTLDKVENNVSRISTKKVIPVFEDVHSIGGTSIVAENDPQGTPSRYMDAGDWFRDATAVIRHTGDSMNEYPPGCYLAVREIIDRKLVVWGKNYVIETAEYRITKRLAKGNTAAWIQARSTNEETYKDGTLIHQTIDIELSDIKKLCLILGKVEIEHSTEFVYASQSA